MMLSMDIVLLVHRQFWRCRRLDFTVSSSATHLKNFDFNLPFSLFVVLVSRAGDVSQNPGPIKYPCTVCSRSVRSNQMALQCDCCQLWTHAVCADVSRSKYADMQIFAGSPHPVCLLLYLHLECVMIL